jgi:hypothetical protein
MAKEYCCECGEVEVEAGEDICAPCAGVFLDDHFAFVHVADDPGVRCDCEDYPCCGH